MVRGQKNLKDYIQTLTHLDEAVGYNLRPTLKQQNYFSLHVLQVIVMQIKDVHVIFHLLATWFIQKSVGKHLLVAYWGQNSSGGKFPQNPEKDLKDVCQERKYDIIVIGFVVTFFGKNNKDQMPEVNFSRHCWDPVSLAHPNLYKCPKIEEGIKACQAAEKKVLISLGGATGNNNLQDAQASILASNLWDLFLGEKASKISDHLEARFSMESIWTSKTTNRVATPSWSKAFENWRKQVLKGTLSQVPHSAHFLMPLWVQNLVRP